MISVTEISVFMKKLKFIEVKYMRHVNTASGELV